MSPKFSLYTPEIAEVILERLADGESLRGICRDEGMPSEGAVRWWAIVDHDGFAARYAHAREIGAAKLAEDLLEIADDGRNDTYITEDGEERTNHEVVMRSKLRLDTRKWLLSKFLPKTFGDRVEINGEVRAVVSSEPLTEDEWVEQHGETSFLASTGGAAKGPR